MDEKKIKIFVTYKDKHQIIKSDIITPIQTGRAIADEVFEEMIGDDTGDNISALNPYFCETSAIYWVWKHYEEIGNPEYVGFMHYRRHLSFINDTKFEEDNVGLIRYPYINDDYFNKFGIKDNIMQDLISKYDVVVANKYDVSKLGFKNCYEHYKCSSPKLHIEDYNSILKYAKEKYPNFEKIINRYNQSRYGYFTNMFIMKKEHFFDFCEWYFDILLNTYKTIENDSYTIQEVRQIGYISEWLFGIYITYLYDKNLKIKELQRTFIDNTEPNIISLEPLFEERNAICLTCDEKYLPYLSVTLQSIVANSSKLQNYDIILLFDDISKQFINTILNSVETNNISIRFFDISKYMDKYDTKIFKEFAHFSKAIYYRLFIPEIFKQYKSVCYLDVDTIITTDISNIFKIDMRNKYAAAVADIEASRLIKVDKQWKKYFSNIFTSNYENKYFNSGVMVFNIQECLKENITKKALELLYKYNKLKFPDQDILNILFKNKLLYLDAKWNYEYHIHFYDKEYKEHLPFKIYNEYESAKQNPYIIHYAGGIKPWHCPDVEFADIWWSYARKTPFYELILKRMMEYVTTGNVDYKISAVKNYRKNILNYWKYKILSNFVFGKTRERYFTKKHLLKSKIRQAKQFRK